MKRTIKKYKVGDIIHFDQLYDTDISDSFIPKNKKDDLDDINICCQDVTIIIFRGKKVDRELIKTNFKKKVER